MTLNKNSKPPLSVLKASADAAANACVNEAGAAALTVRANIVECLVCFIILSALIFFWKVRISVKLIMINS